MEKIDLKKTLKSLYQPSSKQVEEVDVPAMHFLAIDGKGQPGNEDFQQAVEALYTLSYTLKFAVKKELEIDYSVMPLEGLWWAENMADFDPDTGNRDNWQWTLMIMQPEWVSAERVEAARITAAKKKLAALDKVRFEQFHEGRAVQIMHIGPFSAEGPTIQRLHAAITARGGELTGKHHEIYLSDFRKVDPEKMKTVLRQPYR